MKGRDFNIHYFFFFDVVVVCNEFSTCGRALSAPQITPPAVFPLPTYSSFFPIPPSILSLAPYQQITVTYKHFDNRIKNFVVGCC